MTGRALLLAAVIAAPAQASEAQAPLWQGAWQGTIGTLPVRACFTWQNESFSRGAYYYLSTNKTIALDRDGGADWIERAGKGGAESGRWKISVAADGTLRGEWRGGAKVLPVVLRRTSDPKSYDDGCDSRSFLAPRLVPARAIAKAASVPGLAYTAITYKVSPSFPDVDLSGFSFAPAQPGDKAINDAIRIDPDKAGGPADYASCMSGAISMQGSEGEFTQNSSPEWASPAFLAIMQSFGGFCGGAHPDYGYFRELWDRQSGRKVDIARWFTAKAVTPGGSTAASTVHEIAPELRAVALRHFKSDEPECAGAADDQDWWGIGLTRTGFIFTPSFPHVIAACVDDASVPFAEVARFLSPAGKAGVARVRAGGK